MNLFNLRKAVIDTSVLLDALLISYYNLKEGHDSIIQYVKQLYLGKEIFLKNYTEFLEGIECFITTSHAIGELQGLFSTRIGIEGDLKRNFWEKSVSYLKTKKINELLIELALISENKTYIKFIFDIGYIDTGLIELAKKENLPIITDDVRTLSNFAYGQAIELFVPEQFLNYR
ncbi:MAG: hypothetical protein HW421_1009 [Ignavibacteria bacterium]|nr:hypothetical protein [Ignavibacteria bacterium]